MSTQRGRKRGPYKPRVPKTAQDAAKAAAIPTMNEAIVKAIETGEPQIVAPPEPLTAEDFKLEYRKAVDELVEHAEPAPTPPIRFVRYRYGWGYMETAPAILCDSLTLAVLLPHDAKPAAACKFQFRAPAGGWSFTHAQEGADPGQYSEV